GPGRGKRSTRPAGPPCVARHRTLACPDTGFHHLECCPYLRSSTRVGFVCGLRVSLAKCGRTSRESLRVFCRPRSSESYRLLLAGWLGSNPANLKPQQMKPPRGTLWFASEADRWRLHRC